MKGSWLAGFSLPPSTKRQLQEKHSHSARYQTPSQHWPKSDLGCWIRGCVSFAPRLFTRGTAIYPCDKKIHILVRACHHLWMLSVMTGPSRAHAVPHGRSGRRSRSWSSCGRWPSRRCVRAPANPQRPNILPCRHMTALHDGASRRTLLLLRAPSCEKMGGAAARVPA